MRGWGREARYLITDWGGAMGKWGSNIVSRDRWDAGRVRGADAAVRDRRPGRIRQRSAIRDSAPPKSPATLPSRDAGLVLSIRAGG